MESLYKSEKGKSEILEFYNQKLNSLNINYLEQVIETSFGRINVIVNGNQSNPTC